MSSAEAVADLLSAVALWTQRSMVDERFMMDQTLTSGQSMGVAQSLHAGVSRRRLVLVVTGVLTGMLLSALDQTIVGTPMPQIIAELNGLEHCALVFTAYMLASTVMVPIHGKLSDLYGRRPFFPGGTANCASARPRQ